MRISAHQMFIDIASVVAKRSTCARMNVGAIVVKDRRVISIGYNGQLPGATHCASVCGVGTCETIHAEQNALEYAGNRAAGADLYITHAPCLDCARSIINAQVQRVFFTHEYRKDEGLIHLYRNGVTVLRVLASGHVIDWRTQELVDG